MFIPKFTIQEATPQDIGKNLRLIHAEKFWLHTKGGGAVVAVIDTGIDLTHSEFSGRVFEPYSAYDNGGPVIDDNGHGTHVAGIIAGKTVGVAPEARIMPIRAFNKDGKASSQSMESALLRVLDHNKKCSEADKVIVVNCSFSTSAYSAYMAYLIRQLVNTGVAVVASAGNNGDGNPATTEFGYPAFVWEVIAVAATDQDGILAKYSSSHDGVDLAGPGTLIYSAWPGGGYKQATGTSMSAPHVSGALALIYGLYRKTYGKYPTTDQAEEILWQNVTDYGSDPRLVGRGLLELKHPEAFPTPEVIRVRIDHGFAYMDGLQVPLTAAPIIKDDRTYLPVRDLSEMLGREVAWIPETREIISKKK